MRSTVIVGGCDWRPSANAQELGSTADYSARWIAIDAGCRPQDAETVLKPLLDRPLSASDLAELLDPDLQPRVWPHIEDPSIRYVSSFGVRARQPEHEHEHGAGSSAGVLVFEPVKFLATERCLLSCAHERRTHRGTREPWLAGPVFDVSVADLDRLWVERELHTSGDLGVLMLDQLAVGYRPAVHVIDGWLAEWEAGLWDEKHRPSGKTLRETWGSVNLLRKWVAPLNRPGIRRDPQRAWFPNVRKHDEAIAVDDRIDATLKDLRELAERLRASLGLLQVQASDRLNRTLTVATAAIAGPTILIAVVGARTNYPLGEGHTAFFVTLALTLVSVLAVLGLIIRRDGRL